MTTKPNESRVVTHTLKCDAPFWDAVARGEKTFELRKNDRGFQRGDHLVLQRFADGQYSYRMGKAQDIHCTVTYVLSGQPWLVDGYVALSIQVDAVMP